MPRMSNWIDAFVGARIAALRTSQGLSQSQLAEGLGVSFQQVQKYESGANRVSASRLHQLATIFSVKIESLFPSHTAEPLASVSEPAGEYRELRFMTASPEGRAVAAAFGLIEDREVRRALAVLVGALAQAA